MSSSIDSVKLCGDASERATAIRREVVADPDITMRLDAVQERRYPTEVPYPLEYLTEGWVANK